MKISSKGGKTDSSHHFSIHVLIMSCPWSLIESTIFIILAISALVTGIDESVLGFFIECCKNLNCIVGQSTLLSKKTLNSSALSLKFEVYYKIVEECKVFY